MPATRSKNRSRFIQVFEFENDQSKPGRVLQTVRIGEVYMSRLTIDPGVITGNYYHKKTKLMFFVTTGEVTARFENIYTKERKQVTLKPGRRVVHVPPYVSFATKNDSRHEKAVVVFLSSLPLRAEDGNSYVVMEK